MSTPEEIQKALELAKEYYTHLSAEMSNKGQIARYKNLAKLAEILKVNLNPNGSINLS